MRSAHHKNGLLPDRFDFLTTFRHGNRIRDGKQINRAVLLKVKIMHKWLSYQWLLDSFAYDAVTDNFSMDD